MQRLYKWFTKILIGKYMLLSFSFIKINYSEIISTCDQESLSNFKTSVAISVMLGKCSWWTVIILSKSHFKVTQHFQRY